MELSTRIRELALLRERWLPLDDPARLDRRRAHAAWSNAGIEGNSVPWPRARDLLLDGGEVWGHPEERELIGCLRALEFIEGMETPPTLGLIRHLHAEILNGLDPQAGSFRRREVNIVRESGDKAGETVFRPPHPARVPELLERLLATLSKSEDPFLAAGRFHYEFQSIHPFADGNGRLGRLLSTWLARRRWNSAGFFLAPAIARSGSAYYLALRAVRPDYESEIVDGLRPWLLPFFDMVADALVHPDPHEEMADA